MPNIVGLWDKFKGVLKDFKFFLIAMIKYIQFVNVLDI